MKPESLLNEQGKIIEDLSQKLEKNGNQSSMQKHCELENLQDALSTASTQAQSQGDKFQRTVNF